jgi:hypothetical protein
VGESVGVFTLGDDVGAAEFATTVGESVGVFTLGDDVGAAGFTGLFIGDPVGLVCGVFVKPQLFSPSGCQIRHLSDDIRCGSSTQLQAVPSVLHVPKNPQ